ncbi:MAG: sigma-70 family RNA polymerase sigma factor [Bacillota bacterium]
MGNSSYRSDDVMTNALSNHGNMVKRICFVYLRNQSDADDAFQDVFVKLLEADLIFTDEEHMKAWLARVAINKCKDMFKSYWRRNVGPIDNIEETFEDKEESEVMQAVLDLPAKYKEVVYLFYYEQYTVVEMAKLLGQKENTIYSNLHRARQILKKKLGGAEHEYTF